MSVRSFLLVVGAVCLLICSSSNLLAADAAASGKALDAFREWQAIDAESRPKWSEQAFINTPLTKQDAATAITLTREFHAQRLKASRAEEMKAKRIKLGDLEMPIEYRVYGDKPESGRSLYLSLHGGGGAPARVNDGQWRNQIVLYRPAEGVYCAPRAPTNTWNLWHQGHIDEFFTRLIENFILLEDVDPNKVYVMGYSAGGDGVYQLAPRMADQWAAAAMMAGHPNDAKPESLRNIGFTLHMGALDSAYKRNEVAAEWKKKLADLKEADKDGYIHHVQIHEGKGHWMDRQDAVAVPWMAKFTRDPRPSKIVWRQDDVTHQRFYWLAQSKEEIKARSLITAEYKDQTVRVAATDVTGLTVRLDDEMMDLDQPVTVYVNDKKVYENSVPRRLDVIASCFAERFDPGMVYTAGIHVTLDP